MCYLAILDGEKQSQTKPISVSPQHRCGFENEFEKTNPISNRHLQKDEAEIFDFE